MRTTSAAPTSPAAQPVNRPMPPPCRRSCSIISAISRARNIVAAGCGGELPRSVLLQERGDVGQVVEHRENTGEWYDGVIDRQIEDVELTRFHRQVAPQRLIQGETIVERIVGCSCA